MKRHILPSAHLLAVTYDEAQRLLTVEFHQGDVRQYAHIPAYLVTALLRAASKLTFFENHIQPAYQARRVR